MRLTHSGSSNFIVSLLDSSGERLEGIVNHIGSYQGDRPYNFAGDQIGFIGIEADGPWKIELLPIVDAPVLATNPGAAYSGSGDQILIFLADGPKVIDFGCSNCESNIFVTAWGDRRDGLINEIGDGTLFEASVIVGGGTVILEVETSDSDFRTGAFVPGNWTITVQ